jgi:hypothetical protein
VSIYSTKLATGHSTAVGSTDIYTVPIGAGPCILKGVTFVVDPGGDACLYLNDGSGAQLCRLSNVGGPSEVTEFFPIWHVLEPGDVLAAYQFVGGADVHWFVSGQQFATP